MSNGAFLNLVWNMLLHQFLLKHILKSIKELTIYLKYLIFPWIDSTVIWHVFKIPTLGLFSRQTSKLHLVRSWWDANQSTLLYFDINSISMRPTPNNIHKTRISIHISWAPITRCFFCMVLSSLTADFYFHINTP